MRKIYFLLFVISFSELAGQETVPFVKYFDCKIIAERIIAYKDVSGLKAYNLYKYLLLDSTHIGVIEKINHSSVAAYRHDVSRSQLSKSTIGFKTYYNGIEQLLSDERELKKILTICSGDTDPELVLTRFNYPIYIDKNNAIFEIRNKSGVNWYVGRLSNGVFQINYVQGEIWEE
jgi:hypothetical protein